MKDKHQERIKAVKRANRIDAGGPHGRAGIHMDKMERRMRHMDTKDWLEAAEDDAMIVEEVEMAVYESRLNELEQTEEDTVVCSLCGGMVSADVAHPHQGKWIGDECCWDERLKTTE